LPTNGLIYIDACAVIYSVERVEPYSTLLAPLWKSARRQTAEILTSELSLLEVLVRPLHTGNTALEALFRDLLLASQEVSLIPVSRAVIERAAAVRATTGLRTPDAIHVASARQSRCRSFVTNDPVFSRVAGLPTVILHDLLSP